MIDFRGNTYIIKNYQKKFCGGIECVKVESEFQNLIVLENGLFDSIIIYPCNVFALKNYIVKLRYLFFINIHFHYYILSLN